MGSAVVAAGSATSRAALIAVRLRTPVPGDVGDALVAKVGSAELA